MTLVHEQATHVCPTRRDYPESRCTEMRGACMFKIGFRILAENSDQLKQAQDFLTACVYLYARVCFMPASLSIFI
jgi:hypothetical protein